MACSLASSTLHGAPCAITERAASNCIAPCAPAAALQPPSLRRRPFAAAAAASRSRGMQQLTARRRGCLRSRQQMLGIVATMPDPTTPETEKERSPLDYPQEWITPQPSRRPDIFPEFEKLATPMPKPMPGDPELPDEDEEGDKKEDPDKEKEKDPEKDPDKPAPDTPEE